MCPVKAKSTPFIPHILRRNGILEAQVSLCNDCNYWIGLHKLTEDLKGLWRWTEGSIVLNGDPIWVPYAPGFREKISYCAYLRSVGDDPSRHLRADNFYTCDSTQYALCEFEYGRL